jgi:hypothetical protein
VRLNQAGNLLHHFIGGEVLLALGDDLDGRNSDF